MRVLTLLVLLLMASCSSASKQKTTHPAPEAKATHKVGVNVTPYFTSRVNKTKDISYGAQFSREKGNHELYATYERNRYESTDPLANITIKTADHTGRMTYDINKLWGPFTYFLMFEYAREQEGNVFIKYHEVRTGPIGIKYDFIETDDTDISLSYIPLYEYLVEDVDTNTTDANFNTIYKRVTSRNIRNSFRLKMKWYLFKRKLTVSDITFWRPIYDLDKEGWDYKDADFENTFKTSYKLNENFSVAYSNKITWSRRLVRIHNLPSTDMENKWELEFKHSF